MPNTITWLTDENSTKGYAPALILDKASDGEEIAEYFAKVIPGDDAESVELRESLYEAAARYHSSGEAGLYLAANGFRAESATIINGVTDALAADRMANRIYADCEAVSLTPGDASLDAIVTVLDAIDPDRAAKYFKD